MKQEQIYLICDRVGKRMAEKYSNAPIPIPEIEDEVLSERGGPRKSILVTDRCYNRHNDGIQPNTPRMFEYLGEGDVRYLGLDFANAGPMFHQPKKKGEPERIVGHWTNGVLDFTG